jgi:hypothetical protein
MRTPVERPELTSDLDPTLISWALAVARGKVTRRVVAEALDFSRQLSADLKKANAEIDRLRAELNRCGYEADF